MGLFNSGDSNEVKIVLTLDATGAIKASQSLDKELESIGRTAQNTANSGFSPLQAKLVSLDATIGLVKTAINSIGAVAAQVGQTLEQGLRVENLRKGFDSLQTSIGVDSVDSLNRLKDSTSGLISEMDLLQSANQAVLLGVDDGSGAFQQLAGDAIKLGNAMGIDAKNALDSLVVGIGRQSKLVLDNLGIIVNAEDAYKSYAAEIGKASNALTDNEKKLAFNAAASEAVSRKAGELAESTESAGLAYQRLSASLEDANNDFAAGFSRSTELADALNSMNVELGDIDFASVGEAAADFTADIINLVSSLSDFINSIPFFSQGIQVLKDGFSELQIIVEGVGRVLQAGQGFSSLFSDGLDVIKGGFQALKGEPTDVSLSFEAAGKKISAASNAIKSSIGEVREETVKLESGVASLNEELGNIKEEALKADSLPKLKSTIKDLNAQIIEVANSSVGATAADSILNSKKVKGIEQVIQQLNGKVLKLSASTGGNSPESLSKGAEKAGKAFDSLRESVLRLNEKSTIDSLRDKIKKALEIENTQLAENLTEELSEVIEDGARRGFLKSGGNLDQIGATQLLEEVGDKTAAEIADGISEGVDKAAEKTKGKSFLKDVLGIEFGDDQFGQDLALQVENQVASAIGSGLTKALEGDLNSEDIKSIGQDLAGSLANSIGTAFGGPAGGAIAEAVTRFSVGGVVDGIGEVASGDDISDRNLAGIAVATGGISLPVTLAYNIFNSSDDAETQARTQIERFIEDALATAQAVIKDKSGGFVPLIDIITNGSGDFAANSEFNQFIENAPAELTNAFIGVGNVIGSQLGLGFAQGGQVGASVFAQFEGDIDSLKVVVQALGLTFEEAQEQMVNAFLAGDSSALEVVSRLRDMEEAFRPGLAGFAQYEKAFENFIASAGKGRVSIKSLQDGAIEFKETGSSSLLEFQEALAGSSKFTAEQVQQLFSGLASQGIDSLDKLESASDLSLINVIANLESQGFAFADSIGSGTDEAIQNVERLQETISKVPDEIEKRIRIKVSTEYDDDQSRGALQQLNNESIGLDRV